MNGELPNRLQEERLEAGCDEAGRGCLAGPVYAAAVILPAEHSIEGLNDSKSLSAGERKQLCGEIEDQAVAWAVEALTPSEIDTNNILKSSILAMHRSVDALELRPEYLLIDGNYFLDHETVPHRCIVRGDAKVGSIAAASILAKHYRDQYMIELNPDFPQYHWHSNKGYPTAQHRAAIQRYGPTEHHRRSFRLYPEGEQEEMF